MQRSTTGRLFHAVGLMAGILCLARTAQSQVSVSDLVTQSGGLYHYDYTVTNHTDQDVLFIDIAVPPDPSAVQNPTAPAGYGLSFDSGLGLVSLLEDTDPLSNPQFFGNNPVSGFEYDSPFAPTPSAFTAYTLDRNGNLVTLNGTVVPEPGGLLVYAVCAVTGAWLLRRRPQR